MIRDDVVVALVKLCGGHGGHAWNWAHRTADAVHACAQDAPTVQDAEFRLQELLFRAGSHNPLRDAARLVDGPLRRMFLLGAER